MKNNLKQKVTSTGIKAAFGVLALSAMVMADTRTSRAVDTEYETAEEAQYATTYKDIFYSKTAGSPLEYSATNGVDTATGHLTLQREDLYLEGTGDMDFELARYYDSNDAGIGYPSVEHVDELEVDNIRITFMGEDGEEHSFVVSVDIYNNYYGALDDMFIEYEEGESVRTDTDEDTQRTKVVSSLTHNVYGISSGWSYDFPWIETMSIQDESNQWGRKPFYLHLGSRGSMAIATSADDSTKSYTITGFTDYEYSDVKLEDINRTVDGIPCRYLLRDKTGLRTYFNEDGVIVLQKDAHDNTITFTYRDGIYFDTITDAVGREIVFHYGGEKHGQKFLEKVTVQGEKVEGGVSQKTIEYKISETSYKPKNGSRIYGSRLNSATVDADMEEYRYRTVETIVNTSGWRIAAHRADTNQAYLITGTAFDGSETCYEYRAGTIRGSRDEESGQKRDVATQFYYVTREYEEDVETGKKADGTKYDYFQKQKDVDGLVSFADGFDIDDGGMDARQYGEEGLQTLAVVSSYNPNAHEDNGMYSDYMYKKEDIDPDSMNLKRKPDRNVTIYAYNRNKLLTAITMEGTEKVDFFYDYDNDGEGSLVMLETTKKYGENRNSSPIVEKEGYTYDEYRNELTVKYPKAYLEENAGKEELFTMTMSYFNMDSGYPEDDSAYSLATLASYEGHITTSTSIRMHHTLASNGIDVSTVDKETRTGAGEYRIIAKGEYVYDSQGNETGEKYYPDYAEGNLAYIHTSFQYNALGQCLSKDIEKYSEEQPEQNRTYTEENYTYDSFGNELTCMDVEGLVTKTMYDEETGEEETVTEAAGTEYEYSDKNYYSEDGRKNMSFDQYGRCMVEIRDAFGNTIIEKKETAGTWTESIYDYGDGTGQSGENGTETADSTGKLVEERVYTFKPKGEAVIKGEDGTETVNYDIGGKGQEIVRASRHIYDDYGNEIASAEFSGGGMDAEHCSSWIINKETEVVEDGRTVQTSYKKVLDSSAYCQEEYGSGYYTRFDDSVLTETITVTTTNEGGDILSETKTIICDGDREETVTTYEYDEFGTTLSDVTTLCKYENGKRMQMHEENCVYEYDELGNIVSETEKSRIRETDEWETQTTKTSYDLQGNLTEDYTPRGIQEGYATKYEYDLSGNLIKEWNPIMQEEGDIRYQLVTSEYDAAENLTATEEQLTENSTARTEYTYDGRGDLTCIKNCLEDGTVQYTQYAYDPEGNKIRQFTGMTEPLEIILAEGEGEDAYTYAGTEYHIEVSGGNKKDNYSETTYAYNEKNELVSMTDPEGNTEKYQYDVYGNQTEVIDKNGNTTAYIYDYQGRVLSETATDAETGKEVIHTYEYDSYGNIVKKDGVSYAYDNLTGKIKTETEELAGKEIKKEYAYDSGYNCTSFTVSVGGKETLSLSYEYDGFSRLSKVKMHEGGKVTEVASYTYDEDGSLASAEADGAGLVTDYAYDYAGDLTSMENLTAEGQEVSAYTASYQLNGQKTSEKETVLTKKGKLEKRASSYTYDALGRLLKQHQSGEEMLTYTYDSHNNRKEMAQGNKTTAYTYDKNDELLRTDILNTDTNSDAVTLYKYDKNGNQLATVNRYQTESDGTTFDLDVSLGANRFNGNVVNHYDAMNQLTETLTKDKKVEYTYDANGLRTDKTVNGKETFYVWDGDQIVMELDGKGKVKKRYVRGTDLVFADEGQGTEKTYYMTNPHGDVVQLLDEEGTVIRDYEYDAFGNEIDKDKKDDNPYRYSGEYYDKETDSIYLRARYYAPAQGRFLTRDTYTGEEDDPLSLHLYTYCENDGVNHIDPSGHWTLKVHRKITRKALRKVGIKKKNKEKNKKYYNIIEGCQLPDQARHVAQYSTNSNTEVLGCIIANASGGREKKKIADPWHGRSNNNALKLKIAFKLSYNTEGKDRDVLLGCMLHSLEDWYAHGAYIMPLREYQQHFNKKGFLKKSSSLTEESPAVIFHNDRTEVDENGNVKRRKKMDTTIHSDFKDSIDWDFRNGDWVKVEGNEEAKYENNTRITSAIEDCEEYMRSIIL